MPACAGDDEANTITRMVRRKFAFARDVAEYDELIEGEGQEPLNSVYYKNWEDQYRPHCDGAIAVSYTHLTLPTKA